MPSVTDIQQQQQTASSTVTGKATPPPSTTDSTNVDPLSQAVLLLDRKQRNLGKRKEKLESCQEEAKKGKELNKDQKEALQKYPEVIGQIECVKELSEQFKKIQTESAKNQKRLSKLAAEEKRSSLSHSLRQYAQIRYLLENRPTSINTDESSLLDQLASAVTPKDNSTDSISRSVDTVLSIYQNGPATIIKTLTGKTPQEVQETLEGLFQNTGTQQEQEQQPITSSSPPPPPPPIEQEQQPQQEQIQVQEQEQEHQPQQIKELEQTNDIQSSIRILNDYPLQFDTRNQKIPLDQIMQDTTFFSIDSNHQLEDENQDQLPDPNQYLPTITVVNSNISEQATSALANQRQDEQQGDDQWQQRRGNVNRGGPFNNGNGNRNYNRRGSNFYHQQQRGGGGPPRGRYENPYGGNQRPYSEHNRGRGGYRGNRGGGGYRGYNNNNGNGYQKSAQYQQVHSAPPSQQAQE